MICRAFFANDHPYVMLAELQRRDRVPLRAEQPQLDRFGDSRVEAGRYERLLLISGPDPELAPGSVVVAEVAGITEDELADHQALQQRFGDLLRDGTIEVDEAALDDLATTATDELRTVLATPGLLAAGLARHLDSWRRAGYVDIPAAERDQFDRWFELEQRSSADYQTIVVEQPSARRTPLLISSAGVTRLASRRFPRPGDSGTVTTTHTRRSPSPSGDRC